MTNTIIITTGREKRDRVSKEKDRFVEPLDMSNFSECILQVFEMQGQGLITNVYRDICGAGGAEYVQAIATGAQGTS
jgi:hypothetical protein